MRIWLRRAIILLLPLLVSAASQGATLRFDLGDDEAPPALDDLSKPRQCTVTYLVEDVGTNQAFIERMLISPAPDAVAMKGRLPCPSLIPPRIADRALDACRERSNNPKGCVFGDMSRGFESTPTVGNTAENASRCASDLSSQIGVACWHYGKFDVCNVACGEGKEEVLVAARNRCEAKHQKVCNVMGAAPVQAP